MAVTPFVVRTESAEELAAALTAALLPLTSARIFGIEIDQARPGPFFERNLYGAFSSDPTGAATLTHPFQVAVFSRSNEEQLLILVDQFIAANPSFFFSALYVTYRTNDPNADLGTIGFIFYNQDGAAAGANWGGGGSIVPIGPVGGDLAGSLPNPRVVGLRGIMITAAPPAGGAMLVYDGGTNQYVWYSERIYTSLTAAAADQVNQVVGQNIIIANSPPIPGDGVYQLTVKTGSPSDYTFLSVSSSLASGVILDGPIPPLTATNVFAALQQIVALTINPQFSGTVPATTVQTIASVPIASVGEVDWNVLLENGTSRYTEKLHYTHDGATPFGTSDGIAGTTWPFGATLSVTLSGGNLNLVLTTTSFVCTYRVKQTTLPI
jgi:hypothetical protein